MSGVCANCDATKWRRRRGSNRNDVGDQNSRQSNPSYRPNVRSPDHACGLWFVFVRGVYAQPPVSVALPWHKISLTFSNKLTILVLYPNAFRNAALAVLAHSANAAAQLANAQSECKEVPTVRQNAMRHLSHLNARKY